MQMWNHESRLGPDQPSALLSLAHLQLLLTDRKAHPGQEEREACTAQGRYCQISTRLGCLISPQPRPQAATKETNHRSFPLSCGAPSDLSHREGLSGPVLLLHSSLGICRIRNGTHHCHIRNGTHQAEFQDQMQTSLKPIRENTNPEASLS